MRPEWEAGAGAGVRGASDSSLRWHSGPCWGVLDGTVVGPAGTSLGRDLLVCLIQSPRDLLEYTLRSERFDEMCTWKSPVRMWAVEKAG